MALNIISSTKRADGKSDVVFEMDGKTEKWIGVLDGIATDASLLEDYVISIRESNIDIPISEELL